MFNGNKNMLLRKLVGSSFLCLFIGCVGNEDSASSSAMSSESAIYASVHVSSSSSATSQAEISLSSYSSVNVSSAALSSSSQLSSASSAYSLFEPTDACPDRVIFGSRQIKLLTSYEYQNTVEDLVGIDFDVTDRLPTDDVIEDFHNNFSVSLTEAHIDTYLALADDISRWAKERNFSGLTMCNTTQVACNEIFVREFGARAYRRPLTDAEVQTVLSTASDLRLIENDNQEAVRLMMMSLLSSPNFLFRKELGQMIDDPGPTYKSVYVVQETGYSKDVNLILNSDNKQFYERACCWPEDSALIEITGRASKGPDGEWPIVKIRNATTVFDTEFELAGSDTRTHQLFIPKGIRPDTRHFYIFLENSGTTSFEIDHIEIHQATEHIEVVPYDPKPNDIFVLSPHEMASFLSYTFAGTMPDTPLLRAAERNELETQQQIDQHVDRLLQTPRGKKQLEQFVDQWVGVNIITDASTTSKDPVLYPNFDQSLRDALAQEVREMFKHNVLSDAPFSDFFDSDYVMANQLLIDFYGLQGSTNNDFAPVLANPERGGLLTTGAFLGAFAHPDHTAPIIRSVRIRERLMCQYLPDPPNNLDLERTQSAAALKDDWQNGRITAREYFGELTSISACAGCHNQWINPLGFGLEDYDPIGQYRMVDHNGHVVDANGMFFGESSLFSNDSHGFYGAKELSQFLANSERTDYCFAEKAFRFMNATGPDTITRRSDIHIGQLTNQEQLDYSCAVNNVARILSNTQDIKTVFKTLANSNIIRYRKERNR